MNYGIMILPRALGFAALGATSMICDNGTELMNMASFWIFGHMEVWAPMAISALLVKRLMAALIAPASPHKTEYVPKGRRPKRRIQKMLSGYWAHYSKRLEHLVYMYCKRPGSKAKNIRQKGPGKCCSSKKYMRIRKRALRCIRRDRKKRETDRKRDAENQADAPVWHRGCRYYTTREGRQQDHERPEESEESESAMPCVAMPVAAKNGETSKIDNGYDTDSFMIAVDNCCSRCITNSLDDFVDTPKKTKVKVRGIGGDVSATMIGTVKWNIEDDNGVVHAFTIPNTYYNSGSPYRLLSPQHYAQIANDNHPKKRGTWCGTFDDAIELHWGQCKYKRTIKLDTLVNIALVRSAPGYTRFHAFCHEIGQIEDTVLGENEVYSMPAETNMVSDDEESDDEQDDDSMDTGDEEPIDRRHPDLPNDVFTDLKENDSATVVPEDEEVQYATAQAELLAWHYRLGHSPFAKIRQMAARGDLPAYLSTCKVPRCAACMFGKATKRAWRSKSPVNSLKTPPATSPGAVVAVDQMISSTQGLIGQMRGFLTRQRYTVTTVFVDHFSGLSYVHFQKSTSAAETVEGKRAFERYAKKHGVTVKHYHADNGIFAEAEFVRALEADGQTISYCAVNAHHQNGKAEKKIRDLQELARTMMLHAKQRWPTAITANLWPYAMRMANDVSNVAPGIADAISPIEKFSQVAVAPKVKHCHTFGSPVYVLDAKLQTGKSISKWKHKARIGIYLGASPRHSRKVALVLSLTTGHVSPQFHVVFDDLFETMRPSAGNVEPTSLWQAKTGFVTGAKSTIGSRQETRAPSRNENPGPAESETGVIPPSEEDGQAIGEAGWEDIDRQDSEVGEASDEMDEEASVREETPGEADQATTTRSGRVSRAAVRFVTLYVAWEVFHDNCYAIQDAMEDPIAFAASSNPDIMYFDQAMKEPDKEQFEQAMLDEVKSHTDLGHWEIVTKKSVPVTTKVLPSVWAMRRKRRISTGEAYKWKARLNLHGGKQEHYVNYWETYAPVIGWNTIRLFLVMTILNGWRTRQVDFVLAFPQADIECPIHMEIPRGFKFEGSRKTHCLELKKNLYGAKQAGRVWNEYLHDGMIARGFVQSEVDMCLYYRKNVVFMIYTDDGIFCAPTEAEIDEAYDVLVKPAGKDNEFRAFKMTNEGDLSDYLGVKVTKLDNGCIKLSQPHLIQSILDDLGFNERTGTKTTPAASTVRLNRDLHGKPMTDDFHYRSVIGKLNFLEKSTRLDLGYSVHQCARFSADPKESHAAAVKRIGKYLNGTKLKGLILNPREHSFDCWVDADFVGNWDRVNADVDPSTAKSRTGFIITYGACPIVWASKLQTEVALSSTESEYNALSTATRDVIFLMQLVIEARRLDWKVFDGTPTVHCKAFEDNSGALEMARLPKMRPRTKHLCVRLHHFREYVRNKMISIHKIPTEQQLGDIETKPQPEDLFISQRESLMQWDAEFMTKDELAQSAYHLRACDISDAAESLCQIQHEKAERAKELRDEAKLASTGLLVSNPENHLSTEEAHDIAVNSEDIAVNSEIPQNIDATKSSKGDEEIVSDQIKKATDNGWKKVSRHEKSKKRVTMMSDDRARD